MKTRHSIKFKLIFMITALTLLTSLILMSVCQVNLSKIGNIALKDYDESMDEGYNKEIKTQVQTALTVINNCYDQYKSGKYTEEEAKELAKETVRIMRYGDEGDGYFWIDDTDYNLVMHPILPDQEGTNRYKLEDKNGVMIIQNIMKSAEAGGGYNKFYFTKADGKTVAPKIAYSQKFDAWNWVVTTGNYVDNINAAKATVKDSIQHSVRNSRITLIVIIVILYVVAFVCADIFSRYMVKIIDHIKNDLQMIAKGNLNIPMNEKLLSRNDELGVMAKTLNEVKNSLSGMIGIVTQSATEVNRSSTEFGGSFNEITASISAINSAAEDYCTGCYNTVR